MKEIIQRTIAEKKNSSTTTATSTATPQATTSPAPGSTSSSSSSLGLSPSTSTASPASVTETTNARATPPNVVGQPVTAVQVAPLTSSSVSLVTGAIKSGTAGGSKVNIGGGTLAGVNTVSIQNLPQTFSQTALDNLSLTLPKQLREKIAKLPAEQQKFIYFHQLKQMQQIKEQQQQKKQGVASPKVVEKQNQLVKEQQVPLVLGVKPGVSAQVGGQGVGAERKKSNFATMRLIPGSGGVSESATPPPAAPAPSGSGRKKGKGKESAGPEAE